MLLPTNVYCCPVCRGAMQITGANDSSMELECNQCGRGEFGGGGHFNNGDYWHREATKKFSNKEDQAWVQVWSQEKRLWVDSGWLCCRPENLFLSEFLEIE